MGTSRIAAPPQCQRLTSPAEESSKRPRLTGYASHTRLQTAPFAKTSISSANYLHIHPNPPLSYGDKSACSQQVPPGGPKTVGSRFLAAISTTRISWSVRDDRMTGPSPPNCARRAADQVRTRDQHEDREGPGSHHPAVGAAAGGPGDRIARARPTRLSALCRWCVWWRSARLPPAIPTRCRCGGSGSRSFSPSASSLPN
jgi:hypothetical protein